MAKVTLTDRKLKSLKPAPPGVRYDLMDAVVPGFGVRVTDKGKVTFVLVTRYPGSTNPTRRALGEYGAMSLEDGRAKAREWHELIRKGSDPKVQEGERRALEITRQENTFAAVAEDFIRLAVVGPDRARPKQRKGLVVERDIRREFIPAFGDRPISSVNQHDIVRVLDAAVARGAQYQAHNLLGHVRRLFNWAISRGVYGIDRSPCDRMKPSDVIGKKALRTRVLLDAEMRAVWRSAEGLGYPFGPMVQLLMLTGQRKSEVSDARWREFDLDRKLWTIPAERMKGDAPHVVPIADTAASILKSLPTFKNGDYVFSTTFGAKPVSGFSKAKARLDRGAQVDPYVLHDLRRTMRTGLSALPVSTDVAELVIAHARPGLRKVYDQYSFIDEKRRALELWEARLRAIVEPPPANVVRMARA